MKNFSIITNLLGGLTSLPLTLILPPLLYVKLMLRTEPYELLSTTPEESTDILTHPTVQEEVVARMESDDAGTADEDVRSRTIGYGDAVRIAEQFKLARQHVKDDVSAIPEESETSRPPTPDNNDGCINGPGSHEEESYNFQTVRKVQPTLCSLWLPLLVMTIGMIVTVATIAYTVMDMIHPSDTEPEACIAT